MGDRNKRVFALLNTQKKTRAAMAKTLGISKSAVSQWEKKGTEPTYEQCQLLSPFFGVTVDYLYSGSNDQWQPSLSDKDERDIQKKLSETLEQLDNESGLMFDGEAMDDRTRDLLKDSLEFAIRNAKMLAKEKYTPKKYKK